MTPGVDVDGDEGLSLIHDDIAAALEMNLAREGILQLPGDIEPIENWLRLGVELHLVGRALGDFCNHRAHTVKSLGAVHDNALNVFGEEVAHGALDEVWFLKNAG